MRNGAIAFLFLITLALLFYYYDSPEEERGIEQEREESVITVQEYDSPQQEREESVIEESFLSEDNVQEGQEITITGNIFYDDSKNNDYFWYLREKEEEKELKLIMDDETDCRIEADCCEKLLSNKEKIIEEMVTVKGEKYENKLIVKEIK